jgi:hypothetical protein
MSEKATQRKLYSQMYGTNFQRDIIGVQGRQRYLVEGPDK